MTDQKDALKLKGCPFCGGPAVKYVPHFANEEYATCGMPQRLGENKCPGKMVAVSLDEWNTRNENPDCEHDINALMEANRALHDEVAALKARVEKLREALEEISKMNGNCKYFPVRNAKLEADGGEFHIIKDYAQ